MYLGSCKGLDHMMFPKNEPPPPLSFKIGERVRILTGPFARFAGVIKEIDDANSSMKVAVSIFGRPTPVEMEFEQVEKLSGR
jgi:transcriptional antiterminator NusG